MKILHTSDWHIGRKLEDKNLDETHELFFEWLSKLIEHEAIDVLVVAGDIFDHPFPSNNSLKMYYQTLYKLSNTNLQAIVITGGNHDSVSTLNSPRDLLELINIKIIGGITSETKPEDLLVEIKGKSGSVELVVCAVPFLREKDLRISFSGVDYQEKIKQISQGVADYYSQMGTLTAKYREAGIPVVATGHFFISGTNNLSPEEEAPYIGGQQQLSIKQIPDVFDYIALGHIHKPMRIGQNEHIRYCGSPVSLDFGEAKNKNQVVIVDFNQNPTDIKIQYVPQFRELISLKGSLSEIEAQLGQLEVGKTLTNWVSIDIIEDKIDPLLELRINELKKNVANAEIVKLRYINKNLQTDIEEKLTDNVSLNDLRPVDIFEKILENVKPEDKENLLFAFNDLVENHLYEEDNNI